MTQILEQTTAQTKPKLVIGKNYMLGLAREVKYCGERNGNHEFARWALRDEGSELMDIIVTSIPADELTLNGCSIHYRYKITPKIKTARVRNGEPAWKELSGFLVRPLQEASR